MTPARGGRAQGVALLFLTATALHDTLVFSFALRGDFTRYATLPSGSTLTRPLATAGRAM